MKNKQQLLPLNYYLVGGAVRDELLHRKVIERDYVVVGATPEQMISLGFTQVGKDFPVFLHPKTKEEFALARTEKKQGTGYTGFICNASPSITLEQDLLRRDLTVNAMAMDEQGNVIDPYNGRKDLEDRILRHVSSAFTEDPLRVLRVARFAARYHYLGFTVAPETLALMTKLSLSGELNSLPAERIWQEFSKSMLEDSPETFINVLFQCKALKEIWPALHSTCEQHANLPFFNASIKVSTLLTVRFTALTLDINANLTQINTSESASDDVIEAIASKLKIPNDVKYLAKKVARHQQNLRHLFSLTNKKILTILNDIDVWRKPDFFPTFITACDVKNELQEQVNCLQHIVAKAQLVDAQSYIQQGITGKNIRVAMDNEKLKIIENERLKYMKNRSPIN